MSIKKVNQPETGSLTLSLIQAGLENGDIVIPEFQRDYVWPVEKAASLLDSWIKGYPIGSFILWTSKEELEIVKKVGSIEFKEQKNKENARVYVLDGQQRITSVYCATKALKIGKNDLSKIVINLDADETDDIVIALSDNHNLTNYISLKDVIDMNMLDIVSKYGNDNNMLEKIQTYHDRLTSFSFPTIKILNCDLYTATEIFTRLNTGGKPLNAFEIMTAKTYKSGKFNLVEKVRDFIKKFNEYIDYDAYRLMILKAIALCLKGQSTEKTVLSLTRDEVIDNFEKVTKAFEHAVNYFKNHIGIPRSGLIPYSVMLLPYTYFFYKKGYSNITSPNTDEEKQLKNYFWRCILTQRFKDSTDTKIAQDVKNVMDKIIKGNSVNNFAPVELNVDNFIRDGEFTMGSAYIKGLVCYLISKGPKSLLNNNSITFDLNWPIKSNSNNYHHFFPKKSKVIKNLNPAENEVNNICNIILLDTYTNQIIIKNENPSIYIPTLAKQNTELENSLKTHLIDNIKDFGIEDDNFDLFIKKRASKFIESLSDELVANPEDKIDSKID